MSERNTIQMCDCGAPSQRLVSAPRVLSDSIEPIYGADGKLYDSLSGYRNSLTPSGNPSGERFIEVGEEKLPEFKRPEVNEEKLIDSIRKGVADVEAGRAPPPTLGVTND